MSDSSQCMTEGWISRWTSQKRLMTNPSFSAITGVATDHWSKSAAIEKLKGNNMAKHWNSLVFSLEHCVTWACKERR